MCRKCVEDNVVMKDGDVPYKEFSKKYPDWTVPKLTWPHEFAVNRKVRSHIFQKYQAELAKAFDRKPCSVLPAPPE